jgi:hypothetical protein
MTLLTLLAATENAEQGKRLRFTQGHVATFDLQSGKTGMGYLRESWTEEALLLLPLDQEHDYLERKSGQLLSDPHRFQEEVSKTLSALANSGGGHLILGQEDDGTLTGVSPIWKGRAALRAWLEQTIPNLLQYPLQTFRVHQLDGGTIQPGKCVIVIDVGDSPLAPHQANFPTDRPNYFYRVGGHSKPAPHHYLELLRNRLIAAVLTPTLERVLFTRLAHLRDEEWAVELQCEFLVRNTSRIVCNEWALVVSFAAEETTKLYDPAELPRTPKMGGLRLKNTLLPTLAMNEQRNIAFHLSLDKPLQPQIDECFADIWARFYVVSENHIGETQSQLLAAKCDVTSVEKQIREEFTNSYRVPVS